MQKIYKKSSAYWKHGKHSGMLMIAINKNKERKNVKFELIDITKSDWSSKI